MSPDDREQVHDPAGRAAAPRALDSLFERVYRAVRAIPYGRVTSYAAIAAAVTGRRAGARLVGWALHGLTAEQVDEVPWWRVINSQGRISISRHPGAADEQRARLEAEGLPVDDAGRLDLDRYGWEPEATVGPASGPGGGT